MPLGKKYGGRQAGTTNKSTKEAREAIAAFVDKNAYRLSDWLDRVAHGDPDHYIKPNPAKAFELFQSVIEYHVPKLGRMEVAGDPDAPIRVEGEFDIFDELLKHYANSRLDTE